MGSGRLRTREDRWRPRNGGWRSWRGSVDKVLASASALASSSGRHRMEASLGGSAGRGEQGREVHRVELIEQVVDAHLRSRGLVEWTVPSSPARVDFKESEVVQTEESRETASEIEALVASSVHD